MLEINKEYWMLNTSVGNGRFYDMFCAGQSCSLQFYELWYGQAASRKIVNRQQTAWCIQSLLVSKLRQDTAVPAAEKKWARHLGQGESDLTDLRKRCTVLCQAPWLSMDFAKQQWRTRARKYALRNKRERHSPPSARIFASDDYSLPRKLRSLQSAKLHRILGQSWFCRNFHSWRPSSSTK